MTDSHEPILPGQGASDYERYIRTDELLSLQKTPAEMRHRDELLFQTVHQSAELWLKLACTEIAEASARMAVDELAAGVRLLRRATDCLEIVTRDLQMLEHMTPWDYQAVRAALGHGSGFDSPGFTRLLAVAEDLGATFEALLERRGVPLEELYTHDLAHDELYRTAELLLDLDERVTVWRFRHFQVVRRTIGAHVIGTQGTPVEVLGKRIAHLLYPKLWAVRDRLTALADARAR
jgi:tryptophan 2,3-dioxygenase